MVVSRAVTIDGNSVSVETEIIEHFNINDELETKEIVIKESSLMESYDMDLDVIITESAVTEYYITGSDIPVLTSRNPFRYTHTITLIEPYKRFERITMSSLQYTQELDTTTYTCLDVVDRALKLIEIEETLNKGDKRVYDIDGIGTRDANDNYIVGNLSGLALLLYNKKAPEMEFNTPYLSEIFNETFLLLNGRPKMIGLTTVGIKYYNVTGNEILLSDVEEITGNQSIDKFAQKYDVYMENAISENNLNKQAIVYPSTTAWASVRSSETELTTNNFLMNVTEDIERVLKFEIYADVTVNYLDGGGAPQVFNGEMQVDMTDYIFLDKRTWDGLDYEFDINTGVDGSTVWNYPNRFSTVYISGKEILGWHQELDIWAPFSSTKNWHVFLGAASWVGGYIPVDSDQVQVGTGVKPSFNTDVRDFMFRLTYVPKQTVRVQIEKDIKGAVGTLFANQDARVVDSELLGNNLQNRLNREGQKELKFTKQVDNFTEAFQIGDFYEDYKTTKVDNTRLSQTTLSTATLSKNFAKRSERVNLANKPRQTDISATNTIRNDIFTEYIVLSTGFTTNNTYVEQLGINRYLDTFRDVNVQDNPVEFILWSGVTSLLIPCSSQGTANTMIFPFGFDNNIIAGSKTTLLDTIYGNEFVRYTNTDGKLDSFNFKAYGGFIPTPNTFAQSAKVAQDLPHFDLLDIDVTEEYIDTSSLAIYKDSGEVYNFTYQLTMVTDNPNIFVGNKLATDNALVVKDTEQLYLYASSTKIPFGQVLPTGLSKQKIVTGTPADSSEVKIVATSTANYGKIEFTTNFFAPRWAIANNDGEVYMIVNQVTDTIYHNPRNKR